MNFVFQVKKQLISLWHQQVIIWNDHFAHSLYNKNFLVQSVNSTLKQTNHYGSASALLLIALAEGGYITEVERDPEHEVGPWVVVLLYCDPLNPPSPRSKESKYVCLYIVCKLFYRLIFLRINKPLTIIFKTLFVQL